MWDLARQYTDSSLCRTGSVVTVRGCCPTAFGSLIRGRTHICSLQGRFLATGLLGSPSYSVLENITSNSHPAQHTLPCHLCAAQMWRLEPTSYVTGPAWASLVLPHTTSLLLPCGAKGGGFPLEFPWGQIASATTWLSLRLNEVFFGHLRAASRMVAAPLYYTSQLPRPSMGCQPQTQVPCPTLCLE